MFTAKCDGQWLYNPQLNFQLINPKLTLADCAAGSFDFTMDKTHPLYDSINEITSRVRIYRDGKEIWEGRPIKEKDDWYGNRTVTCEGALAYLNDTIQEQAEYHNNSVKTWLTTLINKHNNKVDATRQFKIGTVTVDDNLYRYTNFETTLDAINDKLVNRLGGHLRVRKSGGNNYIDYLKDYPYASTQKIEFGRNLLDFSKNYNLEDIVTAILPLGSRLDESPIEALEAYTDIKSVATDGTWHTKNTLYIQNKNAVDNFGWICKVVKWDDVTEPANLYSKAKKYLTEFQYNDLELEIKAIDFHFVDSEIEALNILDQVQVVSEPHGLDKLFPISKMEIVLNNVSNTTLTLGASGSLNDSSLTSKNNSALKELLARIEEIPTESHILEAAKAEATDLITSGTLGTYVIVFPDEIIVTNNLNYTARTAHVWRWNKNGLGYSSTGYNGTFELAMTANGAIVADRITTGTMSANRIRGGYLDIGGAGNINGRIRVYDANETLVTQLNNTGLVVKKGSIEGAEIIAGGQGNQDGRIRVYDANQKLITQLDNAGILVKKGTIQGPNIIAGGKSNSNGYISITNNNDVEVGHISNDGMRFNLNDSSTRRFYVGYNGFNVTMPNGPFEVLYHRENLGNGVGTSEYPAVRVVAENPSDEHTFFENRFDPRDFSGDLMVNSLQSVYWYLGINGITVRRSSGSFNFNSSNGNLSVSGSKSRLVSTEDYFDRLLYCYETPSPLFGDVGEGTISEDGKCYVFIDSIFAETVTLNQYQVFLQKYGDGELYISERNLSYFIVCGTPGLSFGWELKAKQEGYEQLRLETVLDTTVPENTDYGSLAAYYIAELFDERIPT